MTIGDLNEEMLKNMVTDIHNLSMKPAFLWVSPDQFENAKKILRSVA